MSHAGDAVAVPSACPPSEVPRSSCQCVPSIPQRDVQPRLWFDVCGGRGGQGAGLLTLRPARCLAARVGEALSVVAEAFNASYPSQGLQLGLWFDACGGRAAKELGP